MDFKDKLLLLRKEYNMTQEELATKLNVTRQAVQKWEVGASFPKIDKLNKISEIFNCTVQELIGLEDILFNRKELYLPKKSSVILLILNLITTISHIVITICFNKNILWLFLCPVLFSFCSYIVFHHTHYILYFGDFSKTYLINVDNHNINKAKNLYHKYLIDFLLFTLIINLSYLISYFINKNYYFNTILFIIYIFCSLTIYFYHVFKIRKKLLRF